MLEGLLGCFSVFSRQKHRYWRQIEARAASIEQQESWSSVDENVCMSEAFEWYVPHDGRHWHRLRQALQGLKDIGIDNMLIPPGCKAMHPGGNGYDIYDLYDLGEFNQKGTVATKWGTKDDLVGLAQAAEELGMGIYWDAVLNHKAGADKKERCLAVTVDPKDRNFDLTKPQEIEAWVGFDFPGREGKYSEMKYAWEHFNGTDYNDIDKKSAIYKIYTPGKDWAKDVSTENGNYDYLMFANLDHSHPEVRDDIFNWAEWIGRQLPIRGMRLDAVKHYSARFQKSLIDHLRQSEVGRDWFFVSEFWSGDVTEIRKYLSQIDHKAYAFDAPLCESFSAISQDSCSDLRLVFENTLIKCEPQHAVTFVMNHDTQPTQALEAPISASFKPLAYALILLRKDGYPCVFYGDLYGICKMGSDSDKDKKHLESSHFQLEKELDILPALILARKLYAYGEQEDYFLHRNCIGFVRYGNARCPWGMACVVNKHSKDMKIRMFVGEKHAGENWINILDGFQTTLEAETDDWTSKRKTRKDGKIRFIQINKKGYATFPVASMSVSVWVNECAEGRDLFSLRFNRDIYANK